MAILVAVGDSAPRCCAECPLYDEKIRSCFAWQLMPVDDPDTKPGFCPLFDIEAEKAEELCENLKMEKPIDKK